MKNLIASTISSLNNLANTKVLFLMLVFFFVFSSQAFAATTTIATGIDPASTTIAPGSAATTSNTFTLRTDTGTDVITALALRLSNASSTALVEIVSNDGATVYGSVSNPTGTTTTVTLSTNTLTADTSTTTYKVRITPKTHANLPVGYKGLRYLVLSSVSSLTSTNPKAGSDTSTIVTIDNQALPFFKVFSSNFATKVDYSTGPSPHSVTSADFNNDGIPDLAVVNITSGTVSIFIGSGNGTFATKVDYSTGPSPRSVHAADFNNDGILDLVVANYSSSFFSFFRGNGNGTFVAKVDYTTNTGGHSVTSADFNNDGILDVALASLTGYSVLVHMGNGDGTFAAGSGNFVGVDPRSVTAADFNNDGIPDLAAANNTSVSVLINNGNGTFATKVEYTTGTKSYSVSHGDFNNDGKIDLASANSTSGTLSVLIGNGDGTFAAKVDYVTGSKPESVSTADVDSDGKLDLVVANYGSSTVSVFRGNGNGTFAAKVDYSAGVNAQSVTTADLNNDGILDVVVANYGAASASVLLGTGILATATTSNNQILLSYTTPASTDINSVVVLSSTSAITAVPVDGTTYTGGETIGSATVSCVDTTIATSTADSCVTTGLVGGTSYHFAIFVKDIYGNYSKAITPSGSPATPSKTTYITTGTDPASFTVAPGSAATTSNTFTLKTDVGTDIITALVLRLYNASSTALVEIVSNDGATVYGSVSNPTGTTTTVTLSTNTLTANTSTTTYKVRITPKTHANLPVGARGVLYPIRSSVASWTGVNVKAGNDISTTTVTIDNQALPAFKVLSQSFATKVDYTTASNPYSVTKGDFNGDGNLDLVTANYGSASISVFLGNGNGTFAAKVDYTTGSYPYSVSSGDFNGDGKTDLVVANNSSNSVSVFIGNGNGTFAAKVDYSTGVSPYSVTTGDFNGDNITDLAVANLSSNTISILNGNGNGTFSTKVDYATGSSPNHVVAGDFNNDGILDLSATNASSHTVSVLMGNSGGTFATKVDYTTNFNPRSVGVGDFNGDNILDLVTINNNTASIFIGNGDGTFATRVDYTTGSTPYAVNTADFNNDGKIDLVVTNAGGNSVSFLLGNGDGTFATKVDFTTAGSPNSVTSGDFNNDGQFDLAVANTVSASMSVLLGTGTLSTATYGNSQVTLSYTTPPQTDINSVVVLRSTSAITAVPVDGTTYTGGETIGAATVGCVDTTIATSTADSCTSTGLTNGVTYHFAVFVKDVYGNYSFGITPAGSPNAPNLTTFITTGTDPASVTIAPGSSATTSNTFTLRTESGTDVITAMVINLSNASSTSLVEITNSAGSTVYGSVSNPTGATTTITLSTNTLTANTSTTTYKIRITPKTQVNLPVGAKGLMYPVRSSVASWTGNYLKSGSDVSTTTITIDNLALPSFKLIGPTMSAKVDYTTGSTPYSVTTGDFNGDGVSDLVTANYSSASVSIFLGTGSGTFAAKVDYTTGSGPYSVTVGDFNGDNITDLAVANLNSNTISILNGNGNGTFATKVDYTTGTGPRSVTAGDFNGDNIIDFATANYSGSSMSVLLGNGNGTFATKVDYTTAAGPHSVTSDDFNKDGKVDLVVANKDFPGGVSIFLGNGDGTFATKVDYATGYGSASVISADFNNDGKSDLAVANSSSGSVSVLLGNGDGTFAVQVSYTPGSNPSSVNRADFNNDGKIDLIVTNEGSNSASLFLGNGDGTFATKVDYTTGSNPYSVTVGDYNNDGIFDLATANYNSYTMSVLLGTGTLSTATYGNSQVTLSYTTPPQTDINSVVVLRSTSAITAVPVDGTTYTGGETIGAATVGCVDTTIATSTADSCIATGLTNGVSYHFAVFVKDVYGNYSAAVTPVGSPVTPNPSTFITTGVDPVSVTIAPGSAATTSNTFTLKTDTGTDVITAMVINLSNASSTSLVEITNSAGSTVYGSVSNPTGATTTITLSTNTLTANTSTTTYKIRITPKTHANLPVGAKGVLYPILSSVASLTSTNPKSGSDVSTTTITIDNQALPAFKVLGQSFATKVDYTTGSSPRTVTQGDFNGDGILDLATANYNSNKVSVFMGNGNGIFAAKVDYTTGSQPYSVISVDFNGDGVLDLAVSNYNSNTVSIFTGNGNGTFAAGVTYGTASYPHMLTASDFNGDGKIDLAVTNNNSSSVSILLGNGNGTFATKVDYTTGSYPRSITTGDFNGDNIVDFATANYNGSSMSVLLGNGNGTFAAKVDYTTGSNPYAVTTADFNGDNILDLAVANYNGNNISIFIGVGNGTFAAKVDYGSLSRPFSLSPSDLNNDGFIDLVVSVEGSNAVSVMSGNGDGTFVTGSSYTTGSYPFVTIGDFNNDNLLDLATANYNSNTMSVLLGTGTLSTATYGNNQVTLTYTTPPQTDVNSVVVLRNSSAVTAVPVDGTTYTGGETIGAATVGCVDTTIATSTADSCIATGLTNGVPYHFKIFLKDTYGNYSTGITPTGSPATPNATTFITTGTDPASVTIAPGASAITSNTFTFRTESGTDVISALVLNLQNASSTSLVEIVSNDGATVYGSVSNPTGATTTITLSTNTLTANTSTTTYKVRITPKTQVNLPVGAKGLMYPVRSSVASWTGSNPKAGSDISTTTITIDNQVLPYFKVLNPAFGARVNYTTGSTPYAFTNGDFNNDGNLDLAVPNSSSASVSILLGNGNGTFATKVDYTTGSTPLAISAADFNNDGILDLSVVNFSSFSVSILLGNGNGTFATKVDYPVSSSPRSVTVSDFNNDGIVDIAAANSGSNSVSVLLGNGNGTFATKVDYTTGSAPYSVIPSDFNQDGFIDMAVANKTSNTFSVLLGNGSGTFAAKVDYTTGVDPRSLTSGDFNGDSIPDLAVANLNPNTFSVFIGNGDGTFAAKVDYTTAQDPIFISTSDYDRDGILDLMTANLSSVSVFKGNSNGTFAAKVDYSAGSTPFGVTTADINNDGAPDLMVVNSASANVSVFLGTGTVATVTPGASEATVLYTNPSATDINSAVILRSTSAITAVPVDGTTYTGGETIGAATVACVDTTIATSTADSCIATGLTNGVSYYFKIFLKDIYGNYSYGVTPTGSPTTPNPSTFITTGVDPVSVTIAPGSAATTSNTFTLRTNLDTDIITAVVINLSNASSTSLVEIVSNDGATVYGSVSNPTGAATTSITLSTNTLTANTSTTTYKIRITPKTHANLPVGANGVLYPVLSSVASLTSTNPKVGSDVSTTTITIDNQALPAFKVINPTLATKVDYTPGTNPNSIANGDLNGDGILDLVVTNFPASVFSVFIGNSDGTFATKVDYTAGSYSTSVNVVDLNNDGKLDVVMTRAYSSVVSIFLGNGNGTFPARVDYSTGSSPYVVTTSDLNNDGKIDLVIANQGSNSVSILLGNGNGTFAAKVDYTTGTGPYGVAVADFDGDGDLDLSVANSDDNTISVLLNNSDGTFAAKVDYTTNTNPRSVTTSDFNGDGKVDIVVVNFYTSLVSVFLGNGDGTFAAKIDYGVGSFPTNVISLDFNGDGAFDIVTANYFGDSISLLLGNGDGTFAAKVDHATGDRSESVTSGDFNNDNIPDFAAANYDSSTVSVLIGTGTFVTSEAGNTQVTLSYTTPPQTDINTVLVLRSTSAVTAIPVDGTTYTGGETIGEATVACADTTITPSTLDSCIAAGLTNGVSYHFAVFVKDIYGNYSAAVTPTGSPVTPEGVSIVVTNLNNHSLGQVSNTFSFQNKVDETVYAFSLQTVTESATITDLILSLSGIKNLTTSNLTNFKLYKDNNNDRTYDGGDTLVDGAGIFTINGQNGAVTFSSDFLVSSTTAADYIIVADLTSIDKNGSVVLELQSSGLTGFETTLDVINAVSNIQHYRQFSGGAGGSSSRASGVVIPGAGTVTGGGTGGGTGVGQVADGANIAPDPDFYKPTITGTTDNEWTNGTNALLSDGLYATAATANLKQSFTGMNFNIPGGNTIQGLAVKLDASGTTAAGTIDVSISWDGGNSYTTVKATPTLTGTDVVYLVGGGADTWGRVWTDTEFSPSNFILRVSSTPDNNTLRLDAIEIRVYHQAGGGGGGGGGRV